VIVSSLSRKLSWTRINSIMYLDYPLQIEFYGYFVLDMIASQFLKDARVEEYKDISGFFKSAMID